MRCLGALVRPRDGLRTLERLQELSGVLTVSDRDDFLCRGGIVQFVVEGKRLFLEINQAAVAGAELKISAQLLDLARESDFEKCGRATP